MLRADYLARNRRGREAPHVERRRMYAFADPGGLITSPPTWRLTGALIAYLAGAPRGDKRHNQMLRDTRHLVRIY